MNRRLKVAMDVAALRLPESGIGRYTHALLSALVDGFPEDEWSAFVTGFNASTLDVPGGVPLKRLKIPRRLLQWSWRSTSWPPVETVTGAIDVFHTSDWNHPPQRGSATVTTVHDLGPLDHPEWYAPDIVEQHKRQNAATVERAHQVIAISEFTKARLLEHFSIEEGRVQVVPNGVSSDFFAQVPQTRSPTPEKYGATASYLLYVGTAEPRKNLAGLVRIFERVAHEEPELDLVIVGPSADQARAGVHGAETWEADPISAAEDPTWLRSRVHRVGLVPREELLDFYRGATAMVFPTLYEGFGLPLLEAMASGCPVISSSTTAVPEVVGKAGLLADPGDEDAFADAVLRALRDPRSLAEFRRAGLERAGEYTWERAARGTRRAYAAAAD